SGEPLLVMLSGGADSMCLLDVAVRLEAQVRALHVDHGLRPDSAEDTELCRRACAAAGVPLTVERIELETAAEEVSGNLQAEARAGTSLLLRDEAEVLDRAAREVGPAPFLLDELRRLPAALARLALRSAAEEAAGRPVVLSRRDADRILATSGAGTSVVELPG